jgi:hypothetical protein
VREREKRGRECGNERGEIEWGREGRVGVREQRQSGESEKRGRECGMRGEGQRVWDERGEREEGQSVGMRGERVGVREER